MKIAIFSGSIPSTTFIEHLIEGVAKTHTVWLFGVKHSPKKYKASNIKIVATPKAKLLNLWVTFFRTIWLLLKSPKDIFKLLIEIKQFPSLYTKWNWYSKWLPIILYKPDILHIQWAKDVEYYMFLKKEFDIKIILSLRGAHINYSPVVNPKLAAIYRQEFPHIDGFHAVSKAIGLEAQMYGAPPKRIQVIHSPVPKCFFEEYLILNKNESKIIQIVSVGRFHWIKGFKYMLDAIFLLKQKGKQVNYTIIGPQKFSEELLFQIHQLGLEKDIKLMASLPQDKLIITLKTFDMLVLPSLKEGIANVVLEAMALGLPVLSSDCGGMPEVVIPKNTGWLVPVRDPEALANAIVEIKDTSVAELQNITKNAHHFVQEHFNAEDSIQQFLELYESIVND
ncbi:hypothetical protein DI383_02245 [Flavobacteriaceae bacterium LYZ1037]|nr:hypothetical protein DI383_02245 [Flavobacteriaceae bacterium LYZ1037]